MKLFEGHADVDWENASKAHLLDDLVVAADDERIIQKVEEFGGKAVFTSKEHACWGFDWAW